MASEALIVLRKIIGPYENGENIVKYLQTCDRSSKPYNFINLQKDAELPIIVKPKKSSDISSGTDVQLSPKERDNQDLNLVLYDKQYRCDDYVQHPESDAIFAATYVSCSMIDNSPELISKVNGKSFSRRISELRNINMIMLRKAGLVNDLGCLKWNLLFRYFDIDWKDTFETTFTSYNATWVDFLLNFRFYILPSAIP